MSCWSSGIPLDVEQSTALHADELHAWQLAASKARQVGSCRNCCLVEQGTARHAWRAGMRVRIVMLQHDVVAQ